jgi:hypothetical protein
VIVGVAAVGFAAAIASGLWSSASSAGTYSAVVTLLAVVAILLGLALGETLPLFGGIVGLALVTIIGAQSGSIPYLALPFVGGGLVAVAELGNWSLELRSPVVRSRALLARRALNTFYLVLIGTALSGLLVTSLLTLRLL